MIRRGRNWVEHEYGWTDRHDGWWLFGYWAWAPKLRVLPRAIIHRLITGESNYFYTRWKDDYGDRVRF